MDELPLDFSQPKYDLLLSSPLMNAAGTLGFAPQASELVDYDRLGAFVTNPVSLRSRTPARSRTSLRFPGGFLLHSGYPNPGLEIVLRRYAPRWERASLPVIVHLLAQHVDEVAQMVAHLEGREGLMGIELGLPPDCEADQALEFVQAAVGELPLIVQVPFERAGELARKLVDSQLAAVSLASPRGMMLDQQGQPVRGRLYGPAVFPFALAAVQEVIETGIPTIACGGICQQLQIEAMLEMGAIGVQQDSILWSLGNLDQGD